MEDHVYQTPDSNHEEIPQKVALRKPTVGQVSFLFSLSIIIFIAIGSIIPIDDFFLQTAVGEVFLILLPPILFLIILKYDIKRILRLHNPGALNLVIAFFIMVFSLPMVNILNTLNFLLLKYIFGKVTVPDIPIPETSSGFLIGILVVGVSAGICEEVLFRGVIQRGFERYGPVISILFTAFLFGLMHLDFQRFFGTFLLGAIIGFLVYRSNSIFTGMLAHFTNNAIAVTLLYLLPKLQQFLESNGFKGADNVGKSDINETLNQLSDLSILEIVSMGITFLISASIVGALLYAFIVNTSSQVEKIPAEEKRTGNLGLLWLLPGILVVAVIYVLIGLNLSGVEF